MANPTFSRLFGTLAVLIGFLAGETLGQQIHTGGAYFIGAYLPGAVPATCQQQGLLPNGIPPPALYVAVNPQYYYGGHACACSVQYRSAPGDAAQLFPSWITATVVSSLGSIPAEGLGIGLITGVPDGASTIEWQMSGNCNGIDQAAPTLTVQTPVSFAAPVTPTPPVTLAPVTTQPPTTTSVPVATVTPQVVPLEQAIPASPPPPSSPPPPVAFTTPASTPTSQAIAAGSPATTSAPSVISAANFVGSFTGDGTYYDAIAPPGPQGFDCIQNGKPYAYGNLPTVALNIAQEVADNRAACGQCLLLAGTGTGAGLNPISSVPAKYVVSNQCPECKYGDIDIATVGDGNYKPALDGRWQITWSFVPCASKRRSHMRRQMLGIGSSGGLEHFSPEVDEEDFANLQWQTGRARFIQ